VPKLKGRRLTENGNREETPGHIYTETAESRKLRLFFRLFVLLGLVAAFLSTPFGLRLLHIDPTRDLTKEIVVCGWIIGPPAWFALEWMILLKMGNDMASAEFERHKHTNAIVTKLWLAVGTVIIAMHYGDQFIHHIAKTDP
jgi:hypothetical protein